MYYYYERQHRKIDLGNNLQEAINQTKRLLPIDVQLDYDIKDSIGIDGAKIKDIYHNTVAQIGIEWYYGVITSISEKLIT